MGGLVCEPCSYRMHLDQAVARRHEGLGPGLSGMSHGHVRAIPFKQRMARRPACDGRQARMQRLPWRCDARARSGRLPARMFGLQTIALFMPADSQTVRLELTDRKVSRAAVSTVAFTIIPGTARERDATSGYCARRGSFPVARAVFFQRRLLPCGAKPELKPESRRDHPCLRERELQRGRIAVG